jgi:hypothetical protein
MTANLTKNKLGVAHFSLSSLPDQPFANKLACSKPDIVQKQSHLSYGQKMAPTKRKQFSLEEKKT